MKAIVQDGYGSVDNLRFAEVPPPKPKADEVLVRVRAASVHADVWHAITGIPFVMRLFGTGWGKPKNPIPGIDMAGVVEESGSEVSDLKPGAEVFGETHRVVQWVNGGAFAEYVAVPAEVLATKPANVSFEQAASVATSGMIALFNLEQAGALSSGQKVLINGAGGGVGAVAVQVAKAKGAIVTAVDSSDKLEMLTSLGADHVVDYQERNVVEGSERYDLVFDVASTLRFSDCTRILTPQGKYVMIGHDHYGARGRKVLGSIPAMFALMARAPFTSHLPKNTVASVDKKRLIRQLGEFLASGRLTPCIDRSFPLSEATQALHYLMGGSARGRIVLVP